MEKLNENKDNIYLAELLFPNITKTPEDYEKLYPPRNLPEGAMVTRVAPSPTGHIHFGTLFQALIDERLAHRSGGIFYLRIEDTDQKRELEGAVDSLIRELGRFGLKIDEGAVSDGDCGAYGPYRQRARAEIYQTIAKDLVIKGLAYPCFCSEEDLDNINKEQEKEKANFGYYDKWAKCRGMQTEQIEKNLKENNSFVLRFKSNGNENNRIKHIDLIRGEMELPENFNDIVLLKSDGIPTYHFAHVVDDHFMRTTHVVRGEEWLSTFHYHIQMWDAIGWKKPKFIHTAHMLKQDGNSKRKLSKRYDPEARLSYYISEGYPVKGVIEYLMTILNSNYEEWRLKYPDAPLSDFDFSTEKMSGSGALFDIDKLKDICKNIVSKMTADEVYTSAEEWASEFKPEFHALLLRDPSYAKKILAIGRGGVKPRKDLTLWSDIPEYMDFFYDETFYPVYILPENLVKEDILAVLSDYSKIYNPEDSQQEWFDKIRTLSEKRGFAGETKAYKKNPTDYKGHVGDISMILRIAVTGKASSPDTYTVMQILGKERVLERLLSARQYMEKE